MASLDTCAASIKNARNGTSAETATAEDMSAASSIPRDATNATVTPDATTTQRTITPDTSDENDDNPLIDDASDPDVDACLRVLDKITKDPAAFGTPQHRRLRGAVRAAHGALTAGDFGGDGPARKPTRCGHAGSVERRGTGPATPSSRRRADGVKAR